MGGDSWASTKLVMNAQTICFSGRLSVWAWRRQLSEWPRFEWWSTQPLFRSAVALWALARPAHAALHRNKAGDGFCCRLTSHHQVARKAESERQQIDLGESLRKLNERREWMRGKENEGMDRRDVVRELKRRDGVWLVSALCWWMRIWGIVCRPICSSVGEVVRSQSQGWGPEGQERKVRAASRAEESGRTRAERGNKGVKKCWFIWGSKQWHVEFLW